MWENNWEMVYNTHKDCDLGDGLWQLGESHFFWMVSFLLHAQFLGSNATFTGNIGV